MDNNYFSDPNQALRYLLDKYQVSSTGTIADMPPEQYPATLITGNGDIPLLPWRGERRFIELKNLIEQHTLEDVSTLRFCRLAPIGSCSLEQLLYQELDLCEWLGGAPVKRLFAVCSDGKAANIIVKLTNGISCSVECAATLPEGAEVVDRHEIIARRGVASDRAVDTQVPQHSIYAFTTAKEQRFTDVDAEIFGLSGDEVNLVRVAFAALADTDTADRWNSQHQHLLSLLDAVKVSETTCKPFVVGEDELS